jgi:DNA-binding MarR family transcriptional regulator
MRSGAYSHSESDMDVITTHCPLREREWGRLSVVNGAQHTTHDLVEPEPGSAGVAPADSHDNAVSTVIDELIRLTRNTRATTRRSAIALDARLEPAGYLIRATIVTKGSVRARELATAHGMDKATVSRQVRSLHELGLIERTTDPDDARAQLLRPSPEGRDRYIAVRDANVTRTRTSLENWSEQELLAFATLLGRYNARRDSLS